MTLSRVTFIDFGRENNFQAITFCPLLLPFTIITYMLQLWERIESFISVFCMPTSVGELLILVVIGNCWFPSLDFWLLQMIPPSAFYGERCFSWVLHSKSSMWCSSLWWKQSLCRCLHLGWIPGDRCCARTLDPCVFVFLLYDFRRVFRVAP